MGVCYIVVDILKVITRFHFGFINYKEVKDMSQAVQMKQQFLWDLAKRRKELSEQLSQYNNQEQDLLHFLENERYDAVVMVKVAKQLKDNRLSRRAIKVEIDQLNSMSSILTKKNLLKFAEKDYEYRTNILSDTAHRTKGMKICNKNLFTQQNN
jgi:isocitrate dehydrogenase